MTEKNKLAFIMIGVSGSGKSTVIKKFSEKLCGEGADVRIFSLDDCRMSFAVQWLKTDATYAEAFAYANDNKKLFDAHVNHKWSLALKGDCVFIDNTNLTRKSRARWITEARHHDFTIWAIQVIAPLQVVLDRQTTRGDKSVPLDVVKDMYMRQQEVLVGDEADFMMVVDGTAADPVISATIHIA